MTQTTPKVAGADEPSVPATARDALVEWVGQLKAGLLYPAIRWDERTENDRERWRAGEREEVLSLADDIERQAAAAEQERVKVLTEAIPEDPRCADITLPGECHWCGAALAEADDHDPTCRWVAARAAIEGKP